MTGRNRFAGLMAVLALVAVACGSGDSGDGGTTTTVAPTSTTTSSTSSTSTSTLPPTTTTTTTAPTTTLPGEPFDIVPDAGTMMAAVGVAFDDVLNVRAGPGVSFDIVTTMAPTATDAVSLGEGRLLPQSIWWKLEVNGVTGWANSRYLGMLGVVDDLTSAVVDDFGQIPVAETMLALGLIVSDSFKSEEPASSIVMSVAPSVGDLGEVTYDVIGVGDDAVRGYRLHIFGQEDEGGESFGLKSVEATVICGRAVDADGLCV